jgi:transcriptional repressor NrdR
MKCARCKNADSRVVESRDIAEGSSIRRRRECLKCNHRFTTYERLEVPYLAVIKKAGNQEIFNRHKLISGLSKAVEKRPITPLQLEELAADVERTIFEQGVSEIPSREIGELVMERLAKLDEVAYVRFASVYRSFTDVASFEKELAKLKQKTHATI